MIKAVIFDFDGTLMDNMQMHYESFSKALEGRKKLEPRELFMLEGGHVFPIASRLLSDSNPDESEINDIIERKSAIYRKLSEGLKMRKEAKTLINKLRRLNYRIGLATGSPREVVDQHLSPRELSLFNHITTGDETKKPKPDPEPYLKCAGGLGVKPGECIAIDNAPLGVESAKSAGMICIALTSTVGREDLKRADFVIDNLREAEDIIKSM